MRFKVLKCPNCEGDLQIEDGIDTFFCKYCGYKIVLEGQSDEAYRSKTAVRGMEHEEKMLDKQISHERYKIEKEQEKEKENTKGLLVLFVLFAAFLAILIACIVAFNNGPVKESSDKEEQRLQQIVDEVLFDIENEDFDKAYIKAQSIKCDGLVSKDFREKWDDTRKAVIDRIIVAEKKVTGNTTYEPEIETEKKDIFDKLFD